MSTILTAHPHGQAACRPFGMGLVRRWWWTFSFFPQQQLQQLQQQQQQLQQQQQQHAHWSFPSFPSFRPFWPQRSGSAYYSGAPLVSAPRRIRDRSGGGSAKPRVGAVQSASDATIGATPHLPARPFPAAALCIRWRRRASGRRYFGSLRPTTKRNKRKTTAT